MSPELLIRVLANTYAFRSHETWSRDQIAEYQALQLRELRQYAYTHSPFYQRRHQGLENAPLAELPVVTKREMMDNFDEFVTDRRIRLSDVQDQIREQPEAKQYLNTYWINATSGSTGRPGIFLFNTVEWSHIIASFARGREWGGQRVSLLQRMKMAVVSSTKSTHMSALVGQTVKSPWTPTLRLDSTVPFETIIEQLNDYQPETLVAYAGMAAQLADEQIAGRLKIDPESIFTSSEVLSDGMRRRIKTAWGERIFNQYASTETGGIAAECSHHKGMHVFEDHVIIEVVDKDNQPVKRGDYGDKLLVTTLFSRTQPLIRYELSDSIRLSLQPCNDTLPFMLIDGVQGRTEDTLYMRDAVGKTIAIHPNLFHELMDTLQVGEWQIVHRPEEIHIFITNSGSTSDVAQKVANSLSTAGVVSPNVVVEQIDSIPRSAIGKRVLIKSEVPKN